MKKIMNDAGVLSLPVEYTVAIIVASIVIASLIATSYHLWREYEEKKAVKEVNKIVDEAEKIYGMGDVNTTITIDVNIPNSVEKIVFGSNNNLKDNHYYILMKWGRNMSFYSSAKFCYSILYGGKKEVKIELEGNGEKHVKIE